MPDRQVSPDRREFSRVDLTASVSVTGEGFQFQAETPVSVSMGGIRVPFAGPRPEDGTPCRVQLLLAASEPVLRIEASGSITRSAAGDFAVRFRELDPESYTHLRNLILHNAADQARAEEEFDAHWGIKGRRIMLKNDTA